MYFSPFFPGFIGGIVPLKIQTNSVIISSKGPNKLCRYKRSIVLSEVYGISEEKWFKAQYRLAGILVNVIDMICFKFKLRLKFRKNKHYSYTFVNFHTGLR
jgi:hypothetical protein